jgi:ankyrin repeat-rich membrane spanning protein
MSATSVDTKYAGSRRKNRERPGETVSGSQLVYASSFDLSNTFIRNDYFSDINPRSMRRLMNIVSVTGQ